MSTKLKLDGLSNTGESAKARPEEPQRLPLLGSAQYCAARMPNLTPSFRSKGVARAGICRGQRLTCTRLMFVGLSSWLKLQKVPMYLPATRLYRSVWLRRRKRQFQPLKTKSNPKSTILHEHHLTATAGEHRLLQPNGVLHARLRLLKGGGVLQPAVQGPAGARVEIAATGGSRGGHRQQRRRHKALPRGDQQVQADEGQSLAAALPGDRRRQVVQLGGRLVQRRVEAQLQVAGGDGELRLDGEDVVAAANAAAVGVAADAARLHRRRNVHHLAGAAGQQLPSAEGLRQLQRHHVAHQHQGGHLAAAQRHQHCLQQRLQRAGVVEEAGGEAVAAAAEQRGGLRRDARHRVPAHRLQRPPPAAGQPRQPVAGGEDGDALRMCVPHHPVEDGVDARHRVADVRHRPSGLLLLLLLGIISRLIIRIAGHQIAKFISGFATTLPSFSVNTTAEDKVEFEDGGGGGHALDAVEGVNAHPQRHQPVKGAGAAAALRVRQHAQPRVQAEATALLAAQVLANGRRLEGDSVDGAGALRHYDQVVELAVGALKGDAGGQLRLPTFAGSLALVLHHLLLLRTLRQEDVARLGGEGAGEGEVAAVAAHHLHHHHAAVAVRRSQHVHRL
ncbi:hypothetical protein TYRP_000764 [Tyrophagus putrescentiae]|nr:hypothetical protein TYRP_000764 [Tyrophagus putrescentiae]